MTKAALYFSKKSYAKFGVALFLDYILTFLLIYGIILDITLRKDTKKWANSYMTIRNKWLNL